MRQLINKSNSFIGLPNKSMLHTKSIAFGFSSLPPNPAVHKAVQYQFKFRSIVKLSELYDYILSESEDIKKYGKTILLQFLNEYPMQSFRRSRDEIEASRRQEKYKLRQNLYLFLCQLEGLNFYELNMRYSIFKKLITYVGPDPVIIAETEKYQVQLVHLLQTSNIHMLDIINWLYMLPLNYPQKFSTVAFNLIEKYFQNPQVREYLKGQRSLPALIKRICEKDWTELRNYKNILKFLSYEATLRSEDSIEELAVCLERICAMKLHTVAEKVIPKIVDQIIEKFNYEFEHLSKNKQVMLKIFSCYKHLPLNYNLYFFNKIHNYLKGINQLPSHVLLYLPYNKLTQSEVSYLQGKMFSQGRQDIAPKLIYTIYKAECKDIMTPFMVKQAYTNLLDIWKKDTLKLQTYFQVYIALLFRFSKMRNNHHIDQNRLKQMFNKLAFKIEENRYDLFSVLSTSGIIAFFQLCQVYETKYNQNLASSRTEQKLQNRKERNTSVIYTDQLIEAIKVHYNATHPKSRYFLTQFMNEIVTSKYSDSDKKTQLLFLIQKSMRPEPKWHKFSAQLFKDVVHDIEGFVEIYIRYEYKTLKLTNFIFSKLQENKAQLSTVIELLGSLNLKLLTSLKGKLISPLKRYLSELNLSQFDLTKSSMNSLVQCFRVLFYFRKQIPQFMEYLAINLIQMIEQKCKEGQYVNGKQFCSLSSYIMQAMVNISIKQKTQIIESIVSIIKTLRKKQGLYIKVYELNFLCSNQKYIKINNDVLELHWTEIVETLKKTDRLEHHKDLFLLAIKLHCRQFVELSSFDLRYFIDKCTQMIEDSVLNVTQIKQCLGYDILECEDEFVIEKLKLFMSNMVKLAFRKDKRKHGYFIYEYFLKFFSKLQSKQMVTQICEKLLYEKLYPVQVSNIVPILSKSEIKNKKFVKRILDIMALSDAYVSYQKLQVMSWLQKILYELPQSYFNLTNLKYKITQDITQRTTNLKQQQKTILAGEERSVEDGFQVDDPNFDKNYKMFIEYAWASIKAKNINTPQFKFICRYLFFSIDKLKARIQNPQERKQLSKIKLHHVFKFMKECGFFQVSQEKAQWSVREKNQIKEKLRKIRLLSKMESHLNVMKLQPCEKLQKKLAKMENIQFKHKVQVSSWNANVPHIVEYFIQQNLSHIDGPTKNSKSNFVIHTVKKYHYTPELDVLSSHTSSQTTKPAPSIKENTKKNSTLQQSFTEKSISSDDDILNAGYNENDLEQQVDQTNTQFDEDMALASNDFITLEETQLSLELKPEKEMFTKKQPKEAKPIKPLFSSGSKGKAIEEKVKIESKTFKTSIQLQTPNQNLYKDYNGYLRVEKSLIQLVCGMKCIIYDPERDIFFD